MDHVISSLKDDIAVYNEKIKTSEKQKDKLTRIRDQHNFMLNCLNETKKITKTQSLRFIESVISQEIKDRDKANVKRFREEHPIVYRRDEKAVDKNGAVFTTGAYFTTEKRANKRRKFLDGDVTYEITEMPTSELCYEKILYIIENDF